MSTNGGDATEPPTTARNDDLARPSARDQEFIARLHDVIQRHMVESEFSVEVMGSEVGLSRVQLYRKVKALTGLSPVELLRKSRLVKAEQLLRSKDMNISEAAYAVGFTSPSYFSKCFKDEFGMQPVEAFRK